MSIKVENSDQFNACLTELTEALHAGKVIKKDLTTHEKGGVMWATLSIFCKIFNIDINRSYRPKVVVPNLVEFCFQNREHIDNEKTKDAVLGMLEAFKTALDKNKKNSIHSTSIASQMEIARLLVRPPAPQLEELVKANAALKELVECQQEKLNTQSEKLATIAAVKARVAARHKEFMEKRKNQDEENEEVLAQSSSVNPTAQAAEVTAC